MLSSAAGVGALANVLAEERGQRRRDGRTLEKLATVDLASGDLQGDNVALSRISMSAMGLLKQPQ